MKDQGVYIYSAAAHTWPADEVGPPDLKPMLQTAWGKRFRRINHFIELALIGVKTCLDRSRIPVRADCDIYLTTEHGNVADVAKITETLFKQQEAPMPLDFLNVPNNMAGFYLAQNLGLHSSNLTIAHRAFPFETGLDIAMFSITTLSKPAPCALVGSVEECAYPLNQHRQRIGLTADTPLAEGSSWLYIGRDDQKAQARCEWVKFFQDMLSLSAFLQVTKLATSTYLAGGGTMDAALLEQLASTLNIHNRYTSTNATLYSDANCAFTIASFVSDHPGHCLVHINRDKRDRYAVVCISATRENEVTNG